MGVDCVTLYPHQMGPEEARRRLARIVRSAPPCTTCTLRVDPFVVSTGGFERRESTA